MACNPVGENDRRILQFWKIRMVNDMANDIGYFAMSQGYENLMDKIDMTCGAVPEGEYEQVIDQSAPHQFLELYMHIAESRFALAVTECLRMNQAYWPAIMNYCREKGTALHPEKIRTVEAAYEVINNCILDGMPCDETKKITIVEPNRIAWEKLIDTHESAWKKAGSDVDLYYQLQTCLIEGLLGDSGFKYTNEGNLRFSISK